MNFPQKYRIIYIRRDCTKVLIFIFFLHPTYSYYNKKTYSGRKTTYFYY